MIPKSIIRRSVPYTLLRRSNESQSGHTKGGVEERLPIRSTIDFITVGKKKTDGQGIKMSLWNYVWYKVKSMLLKNENKSDSTYVNDKKKKLCVYY